MKVLTTQPVLLLSPRSSKFISTGSDLERSRDATQCSSTSRGDDSPTCTSRTQNRCMSTAKRVTFTKLTPKSLERFDDLDSEESLPARTNIHSCVLEVPRQHLHRSRNDEIEFGMYFRSNELGEKEKQNTLDDVIVCTHKRQQVKLRTTRPVPSVGDVEEDPNQTFDFKSKLLTTEEDFVTKNSVLPSNYSLSSEDEN